MKAGLTQELTKLRQICTAGLAPEILMPEALRHLHQIVPSDINVCHWCDADGRHSGVYGEDPVGWLREDSHGNLVGFQKDSGVTFREAMLFGKPTGNLRGLLDRPGFRRSESFRGMFEPYGLRWILDGVLRDDQRPWGMVVMARGQRAGDFSRAEDGALLRCLPYLVHAMRSPGAIPGAYLDGGRAGLLLFSPDGQLLESSPRARENVLLALGEGSDGDRWGSGCVMANLGQLARQLVTQLLDAHGAEHPPLVRRRNRWGEFAFRAYRTEGESGQGGHVAVLVEHLLPLEVGLLRRIVDSPLTARQKEVCWLLTKGLDAGAIAESMRVSPATLKDYFQGIYRRLKVSNRDELLRTLLLPASSWTPGDERPADTQA